MANKTELAGKLYKWSLDALTVRDRLVFAYGWILGRNGLQPQKIVLKVTNSGEERLATSLEAKICCARPDVAALYNEPYAYQSGFFVYGRLPHSITQCSDAVICITWEDGSTDSFLTPVRDVYFGCPTKRRWSSTSARIWRTVVRVVGIARREGLDALYKKISRRLKIEKGRKNKIEVRRLKDLLDQRDVVLVIDHDLGGGANYFSERHIEGLVQSGHVVLRYTYSVARLQHFLIVNFKDGQDSYIPVSDWSQLVRTLDEAKIDRLIYNTAVSLPDAASLAYQVVEYCSNNNARITMFLHDYFTVCPSHFLLNEEGRYCGIPNVAVCRHCLSKSNQGFTALYPDMDIESWRNAWGLMLAAADEVVTFSNAAAQIFLKVYPFLKDKLVVKPHTIDYLPAARPLHIDYDASCLTIGIVGAIGEHKGAKVVRALAEEILRQKCNARIVVIGTIDIHVNKSVVTVTGGYQKKELPFLLEQYNIHLVLFPSICPETFSYVVHELIALEMPIAVFDLGAQAESVSKYAWGRVIGNDSAANILNELVEFANQIKRTKIMENSLRESK